MVLKYASIILSLSAVISCANNSIENPSEPSELETKDTQLGFNEPFFNIKPTSSPQVLAPDFISTALTEYNGTFSPDGTEFYYTSEVGGIGYITFSELDNTNNWTNPEIASFSGQFSEYDPLFSPDGSKLYFSSERPVSKGGDENKSNIWFVERRENDWGEPVHVPLTGIGDYYSSLTNEGNIYFNSWETGKILKAEPNDTGYVISELSETINSGGYIGDPFISPNEEYIIFRAYYDDGHGNGDLYISFNNNGNWTRPENLGEPINSSGHEMCPALTADGKTFIFASNRLHQEYTGKHLNDIHAKFNSTDNGQSNIYYMTSDFIKEMRTENDSL